MNLINEDFEQRQKEIALQESAIHEKFLRDLLNKHGIMPTEAEMADANGSSPEQWLAYHLEMKGYQLERMMVKGKDGSEYYTYRLYKLVDNSPKYKIKRVISVEESEE